MIYLLILCVTFIKLSTILSSPSWMVPPTSSAVRVHISFARDCANCGSGTELSFSSLWRLILSLFDRLSNFPRPNTHVFALPLNRPWETETSCGGEKICTVRVQVLTINATLGLLGRSICSVCLFVRRSFARLGRNNHAV